ncbi:unnamed protein product [Orchesella dallaii]|uniref:Uncharacterized protein n=1 Tax=Orchesella dallaii TaxID=48710 RepID=A0ABP1S1P9_9HEXA
MKQKESEVDEISPANESPNGNENVGLEMGESITPQATIVLEAKIPPPPPLIKYQEVEEDYVHDSATKQNTLPSYHFVKHSPMLHGNSEITWISISSSRKTG